MEISDVRIDFPKSRKTSNLLAFFSVVFDYCQCDDKIAVTAKYCGNCGAPTGFNDDASNSSSNRESRTFFDIACPIDCRFRQHLEDIILDAYDDQVHAISNGTTRSQGQNG